MSEYTWRPEDQDLTVKKKIGVGTREPTESLEVIGTIKGTKFIGDGSSLDGLVTTTKDSTINGSLTISNDLNVKDNFQLGTLSINKFSNDGNLAENSNLALPTEQAVKSYVDGKINQVNNNLDTKAALSYVDQKIKQVNNNLNAKASLTDVDEQIKQVNTNLNTKAALTDVDEQIKQVNNSLSTQAPLSYVDQKITQVNTNLNTKAALTYVDQKIQGIHSSLSTDQLKVDGNLTIDYPGSTQHIEALNIDVGSFGTPHNASSSYYFRVRDIGAGPVTHFSIRGDGLVYAAKFKQGSSRVLKENIVQLSLDEAIETLKELNPVKFNYRDDNNKILKAGFIAEEIPDLLASTDRASLNPLEIISVLTKVMQEQQKAIVYLTEKVSFLEKKAHQKYLE